ncbi:TonB-linked SusC/RagA family outer membrane protein [Lewinella aquimaris]|uniref:TonB-linked SusC/RagA family outer membrane protein n=1 Tax=Neolewinella aquimaris TaxID=1835722 RepID=A0A840EBE3_9BACT|nr:TonB-dependent receptor [Neolewinella aquimaris]MBB4079119.1 TonB-linked SusC/RagA family outer membrane protein [Neolewinella aquimaris]
MKRLLLSLFCLGFVLGLTAQTTVSGTITDQSGEPLIGASVLAEGTSTGTVSDIDGNFSLNVPAGVEALVASYTGFKTQNIPLDGRTTYDIVMDEDAAQLSEVVVVGYGKQIRSTLTGNIAQIEGDAIQNLPVTSAEQAIQGRTAGVFVQAVSGKPGGRINVRVRGSSSISAGNNPLYVVDGVPITSGTFSSPGSGSQNFLADLNPNDIQSIEILKDASSAAIYGSRAANGVVLITTKEGVSGRTKINFNVSFGSSEPSRRQEFLNAQEFVEFFQQTARGGARYDFNNGLNEFGLSDDEYTLENTTQAYLDFVEGRFDRYSGPSNWRTNETNTNWEDEAFRTGQSRNADLSASGGSDKLTYYASFGYSDQEGILVDNGFQRLSTRLNLDAEASDRFRYGLRLGLSRSDNSRVSNDNQFSTPLQLIALSPITPVRNTTGEEYQGFEPGQLFDRPVTTYYNGLVELENSEKQSISFRTLANVFGEFDLVEGLSLRAEAGVDVANIKQDRFLGRLTDGGESTNGFADSRWSNIVNYNTKALLLYNKDFDAGHNVDFVGGIEFQKSDQENILVEGQEFPLDQLRTIASAAEITDGTTDLTEFTFLSYFGRANYNFNRKYLFSISGRLDGSSRFGTNNQYGFFPAVAAGWVISEEDFFESNATVSYLKLRSSYGLTGNADINNFASRGLYDASSYAATSGLGPIQIANPDLTWEETAQFDVGIDFGLFNNRLSGEVDYYVKNTNDLLLNVPVPGTTGFRTQFRNVGELRNRGVEVLLNAVIFDQAFSWSSSANFALNENEILSLAEGQDIIDDGGSRYMNVVKVGESIGTFYGYEYAGVDPANGDGLFYINEQDDDGNIINPEATTNSANEANFVVLGDALPNKLAGWTNDFSYKGVSLSVFMQGSFGNQVHNSAGVFQSCGGCWFDNQTRDQLDAWTPENTITNVPEARFFWGNADNGRSSRYLSSGNFVRLKTVTLSYELPTSIVDRIGVNRLRFYVTGQNLAIITNYAGWDPEVAADFLADDSPNVLTSVDFYTAPQPRTIIFGINVGL